MQIENRDLPKAELAMRPNSQPSCGKRRWVWLFEIAIALTIISLLTPFVALATQSICQKRLRELRSMQLHHLASLIWFEQLQKCELERGKIGLASFDEMRKIALPEKRGLFQEGSQTLPYRFSLSFERKAKRRFHFSRQLNEQLICAKMALWWERDPDSKILCERYLLLQRSVL